MLAGQTFAGKVVLISGASSGIGAESAKLYARAGASVALSARSKENIDKTVAEILKEVPSAKLLAGSVDARDTEATTNFVKATIEKFGRLDVLVANAGASSSPTLGACLLCFSS